MRGSRPGHTSREDGRRRMRIGKKMSQKRTRQKEMRKEEEKKRKIKGILVIFSFGPSYEAIFPDGMIKTA
jgi:hypothetical protein